MPLLGANREWGEREVKGSDYIIVSNLARLRIAQHVLHECRAILGAASENDLIAAQRHIGKVIGRLEVKLEMAMGEKQ